MHKVSPTDPPLSFTALVLEYNVKIPGLHLELMVLSVVLEYYNLKLYIDETIHRASIRIIYPVQLPT